jgi:hypothetical protein
MRLLLLIIVYIMYIFGGVAPNPFAHEFCPPHVCPPTVTRNTIRAAPAPTITETPEPEEPWACPVVGDLSWDEYKGVCKTACRPPECKPWKKTCEDCYGGE